MRKTKRRLIFIVVFLTVLSAIFLISYEFKNISKTNAQTPFSQIRKTDIAEIKIAGMGKTINLQNIKGTWFQIDNQRYKADDSRIDLLIVNIISLKKGDIVSINPKNYASFGIDQQKIEFKTGAKNNTIYIGDSPSVGQNYARLDSGNEVFVTSGFDNVFTPPDYRDLNLHLVADENQVTRVEIDQNGSQLVLNKNGDNWKIGDTKAVTERVDYYINDLKTLKATDLLPSDINLPDLSFIVNVQEKNNKNTVDFYKKDESNYFAKTTTATYIYQVPAAYVDSLMKEEKDFVQ